MEKIPNMRKILKGEKPWSMMDEIKTGPKSKSNLDREAILDVFDHYSSEISNQLGKDVVIESVNDLDKLSDDLELDNIEELKNQLREDLSAKALKDESNKEVPSFANEAATTGLKMAGAGLTKAAKGVIDLTDLPNKITRATETAIAGDKADKKETPGENINKLLDKTVMPDIEAPSEFVKNPTGKAILQTAEAIVDPENLIGTAPGFKMIYSPIKGALKGKLAKKLPALLNEVISSGVAAVPQTIAESKLRQQEMTGEDLGKSVATNAVLDIIFGGAGKLNKFLKDKGEAKKVEAATKNLEAADIDPELLKDTPSLLDQIAPPTKKSFKTKRLEEIAGEQKKVEGIKDYQKFREDRAKLDKLNEEYDAQRKAGQTDFQKAVDERKKEQWIEDTLADTSPSKLDKILSTAKKNKDDAEADAAIAKVYREVGEKPSGLDELIADKKAMDLMNDKTPNKLDKILKKAEEKKAKAQEQADFDEAMKENYRAMDDQPSLFDLIAPKVKKTTAKEQALQDRRPLDIKGRRKAGDVISNFLSDETGGTSASSVDWVKNVMNKYLSMPSFNPLLSEVSKAVGSKSKDVNTAERLSGDIALVLESLRKRGDAYDKLNKAMVESDRNQIMMSKDDFQNFTGINDNDTLRRAYSAYRTINKINKKSALEMMDEYKGKLQKLHDAIDLNNVTDADLEERAMLKKAMAKLDEETETLKSIPYYINRIRVGDTGLAVKDPSSGKTLFYARGDRPMMDAMFSDLKSGKPITWNGEQMTFDPNLVQKTQYNPDVPEYRPDVGMELEGIDKIMKRIGERFSPAEAESFKQIVNFLGSLERRFDTPIPGMIRRSKSYIPGYVTENIPELMLSKYNQNLRGKYKRDIIDIGEQKAAEADQIIKNIEDLHSNGEIDDFVRSDTIASIRDYQQEMRNYVNNVANTDFSNLEKMGRKGLAFLTVTSNPRIAIQNAFELLSTVPMKIAAITDAGNTTDAFGRRSQLVKNFTKTLPETAGENLNMYRGFSNLLKNLNIIDGDPTGRNKKVPDFIENPDARTAYKMAIDEGLFDDATTMSLIVEQMDNLKKYHTGVKERAVDFSSSAIDGFNKFFGAFNRATEQAVAKATFLTALDEVLANSKRGVTEKYKDYINRVYNDAKHITRVATVREGKSGMPTGAVDPTGRAFLARTTLALQNYQLSNINATLKLAKDKNIKELGYLVLSSALLGGVRSIPGAALAGGLVSLGNNILEYVGRKTGAIDDPELRPLSEEISNSLRDYAGKGILQKIMAQGIPSAAASAVSGKDIDWDLTGEPTSISAIGPAIGKAKNLLEIFSSSKQELPDRILKGMVPTLFRRMVPENAKQNPLDADYSRDLIMRLLDMKYNEAEKARVEQGAGEEISQNIRKLIEGAAGESIDVNSDKWKRFVESKTPSPKGIALDRLSNRGVKLDKNQSKKAFEAMNLVRDAKEKFNRRKK